MSKTTEIVIWCDLCGLWHRDTRSLAVTRRSLKKSGWLFIKATTSQIENDFCPDCVQVRKKQSTD